MANGNDCGCPGCCGPAPPSAYIPPPSDGAQIIDLAARRALNKCRADAARARANTWLLIVVLVLVYLFTRGDA